MNVRTVLLMIACAGLLQACATATQRMQAHLAAQMKASAGLTLHQARLPKGIIEQRNPTELRTLANGHLLYIYRDYWTAKGITGMPCDVFLEVSPKGQTIVTAYASGSGCYSLD